MITFWIGVVLSVSLGIVLSIIQGMKRVEYDKALYKKEVLEYRLENGGDIYGNELLYNEIIEFNNELRDTKYWSSNLWTSWFNNDLIATIDYIEIEGR